MVADAGGTPVLLRLVQSAGRDKGSAEGLRWALLCLAHLSRYRLHAEVVFGEAGLLVLVGDILVANRDREVRTHNCK